MSMTVDREIVNDKLSMLYKTIYSVTICLESRFQQFFSDIFIKNLTALFISLNINDCRGYVICILHISYQTKTSNFSRYTTRKI